MVEQEINLQENGIRLKLIYLR